MVAVVALGLLALVGLVVLAKLFVAANPAALAKGLRWAGLTLAVLAFVAVSIRGQVAIGGVLMPLIYLLARGWRPAWLQNLGRQGRPSAGQTSSIRTAFLDLTLDHDSGALSGTVLRGRSQGRRIETMAQAELVALWHEAVAEDPPSAQLVETCLDRAYPDWRETAEPPGGGPRERAGAMSRDEALRILELGGEPTETEIVEAHRRLMMANHPDRGGSAYLAALINQAKEVLTRPR